MATDQGLWKGACEETLGHKTRQHKEWVSLEMAKKIMTRKEQKKRLNKAEPGRPRRRHR